MDIVINSFWYLSDWNDASWENQVSQSFGESSLSWHQFGFNSSSNETGWLAKRSQMKENGHGRSSFFVQKRYLAIGKEK